MTKIPKFLFCENKLALPGAGLILCTESPFYYAQILKGLSTASLHDFAIKNNALAVGKPYGYNVGVIVLGTLHSSLLINDQTIFAKDLAKTAREMSDFYLEEKILPNENYYKRYKE